MRYWCHCRNRSEAGAMWSLSHIAPKKGNFVSYLWIGHRDTQSHSDDF